jgi:hypothetical protein
MPDFLDIIKQYAGIFGKGLLLQIAPGVAEGFINKLFHEWKVDTNKVWQDVLNNKSLLDEMKPEQLEQLKTLKQRVGSLDFITPDLVIKSIKDDFSGVASLFMNWPPAGEWLAKQIEGLKKQADSE